MRSERLDPEQALSLAASESERRTSSLAVRLSSWNSDSAPPESSLAPPSVSSDTMHRMASWRGKTACVAMQRCGMTCRFRGTLRSLAVLTSIYQA